MEAKPASGPGSHAVDTKLTTRAKPLRNVHAHLVEKTDAIAAKAIRSWI
jgi:hypothetical protein